MDSNNKTTVKSGGIGFTGLIAIVFIVLKLCKIITWSWLWVLSPIWIPTAIVLLMFVIGLLWIAFSKNRK